MMYPNSWVPNFPLKILLIFLVIAARLFGRGNAVAAASAASRLPVTSQSGSGRQTLQQFQVVVLPPGTKPNIPALEPQKPQGSYVWLQIPVNPPKPNSTDKNPPDQAQPGISTSTTTSQDLVTDDIRPSTYHPTISTFAPPASSTTTTTSAAEEPNPLLVFCTEPRGQFPSDFCNTFVNCWDGTAIEQYCPETLVFNPKGFCDFGSDVFCGDKPIKVSARPTAATEKITIEGASQSANGSSEEALTSSPTKPASATTAATITYRPTDQQLTEKCLEPRGQFPAKQCNRYVNCWDGIALEQECPEKLLFSEKGYCDYAYNVDCGDRIVPEISNEIDGDTGISNGDQRPCPTPYGQFQDPQNCSLFHTCSAGQVTAVHNCPSGLYFSNKLGVCDYSDRVDCPVGPPDQESQAKNVFLENISPEIMHAIENCQPNTVFVVNPQCTVACRCPNEGPAELIVCPDNMAFDVNWNTCLPADQVKCSFEMFFRNSIY